MDESSSFESYNRYAMYRRIGKTGSVVFGSEDRGAAKLIPISDEAIIIFILPDNGAERNLPI